MQAPSVVPKRCIHKIVTACNLTQAICCACLDARPDGFNFALHKQARLGIDGTSLAVSFFRLSEYKSTSPLSPSYIDFNIEHGSGQDSLGQRHRRPLGLREVYGEFSDVIIIKCWAGSIDITRSVDLTLDRLRVEVARLMLCDPRHLMASDITMYNGRVAPGMSDDDALVSRATYVKFKRVINVEPKDIEMKMPKHRTCKQTVTMCRRFPCLDYSLFHYASKSCCVVMGDQTFALECNRSNEDVKDNSEQLDRIACTRQRNHTYQDLMSANQRAKLPKLHKV